MTQTNVEKVDQVFKQKFFGITTPIVEKKYLEENRDLEQGYSVKKGELTNTFSSYFDDYVTAYGEQDLKLADSFFDQIQEIARVYVCMKPFFRESQVNPTLAIPYCQLSSLLKHPAFMRDERCIQVIQILSALETEQPWHERMYVEGSLKKKTLKVGIDTSHIDVFRVLINDENLWYEKIHSVWKLFRSIVGALDKMSTEHIADTFPLRLKVWFANIETYNAKTEKVMAEKEAAEKEILERLTWSEKIHAWFFPDQYEYEGNEFKRPTFYDEIDWEVLASFRSEEEKAVFKIIAKLPEISQQDKEKLEAFGLDLTKYSGTKAAEYAQKYLDSHDSG